MPKNDSIKEESIDNQITYFLTNLCCDTNQEPIFEKVLKDHPDNKKYLITEIFKELNCFYQNNDLNKENEQNEAALNEIMQKVPLNIYRQIFFLLIRTIVNDESLSINFSKLTADSFLDGSKYKNFQDIQNYKDIFATFNLGYDQNLNFYIQKNYVNTLKKEEIEREKHFYSISISKFIVNSNSEINNNTKNSKIAYIPYYPYSLSTILINNSKSSEKPETTNKIKLSNIERIKIILEIAQALNDLHMNNMYHGNLSHLSIFLDSDFNAYIGGFIYDQEKNILNTKFDIPNYYSNPKKISQKLNENNKKDSDEFIKQMQFSDIYSFGILMLVILVEKSPDLLFDKSSREFRVETLMNGYKKFLFDNFKDFFEDESNKEFKDIISDCIDEKLEFDKRNFSMETVIDSIKKLNIYQQNKKIIEFLINSANDSSKYKCRMSDMILSFYYNQKDMLKTIKLLFNSISSQSCDDDVLDDADEIKYDGDIIKYVNEKLIPPDVIYSHINKYFTIFIQNYSKNLINFQKDINYDDTLWKLSMNRNFAYRDQNSIENSNGAIIPVASFRNFVKDNKNVCNENQFTWSYLIAKELAYIHSIGQFHGEISEDSIGIYFNDETETFIPSLILFYGFYKQNAENQIIVTKKKKKKKYEDLSDDIEKKQKKDLKDYLRILKEKFNMVYQNISNNLNKYISFNEIIFDLYNCAINNLYECDVETFKANIIENYSNYEISFASLMKIKELVEINNSFILKDDIINEFHNFIRSSNDNINMSIEFNLNNKEISEASNSIYDIFNLCKLLNEQINNLIEVEKLKELDSQNEGIIEKPKNPKFEFYSYKESRMNMIANRLKQIKNKVVYRYYEFEGIYKKSFDFLFRRTIKNLNPDFKYLLCVKLNNKTFLDEQDVAIGLNDVIRAVKKINPSWKTPEPYKTMIYVYCNIFENSQIELNDLLPKDKKKK